MKIIRDVLRHYHGDRCSKRQIAVHLGLSRGTVRNYLRRAAEAGVSWPLPKGLTDEDLEALLFPAKKLRSDRPQPDWAEIHVQLSRKGMTLERAWHNYRQAHPDGYSYGHFCERYKDWSQKHKVSMRLHHKAGRSFLLTMPVTRLRSRIPKRARCAKRRFLLPPWAAPVTPMWRQRQIRRFVAGSGRMFGRWRFLARRLRSWSATT